MNFSLIVKKGLNLIYDIEKLGPYEAYIVGGAVRDTLLGNEVNDADIATNCPIKVLESKFQTYELGKSKKFGIVIIKRGPICFDVAQFRADGDYSDNRHPDDVKIVNNIVEDVLRRDFTINALVMDRDGNIIDRVGGIKDIKAKKIKTVGNPYRRFEEDRLRMLRCARFASAEGFTIGIRTKRAIRRLAKSINSVSKERIHAELLRSAKENGERFARYILILDDLHLLSKILPEVSTLKYFKHKLNHHPEGHTVFEHVIKCVEMSKNMTPLSKIAILLHDIGKSIAFQDKSTHMSYYGHAHIGAEMAQQVCERLKFSLRETEAIVFAVSNHMKFHRLLEMKPSKIARLVNNPYFPILKDVGWVDEFSRGETFRYAGEFKEIISKANEIKEKWENRVMNHTFNLVNGHQIMKYEHLNPGKMVGAIKKAVENRIVDEDLDPDDIHLINQIIREEHNKLKEED